MSLWYLCNFCILSLFYMLSNQMFTTCFDLHLLIKVAWAPDCRKEFQSSLINQKWCLLEAHKHRKQGHTLHSVIYSHKNNVIFIGVFIFSILILSGFYSVIAQLFNNFNYYTSHMYHIFKWKTQPQWLI